MKKTFFLLAALCWLTTVSAQTRITVDDLSAKWQSQNLKAPKSGGILDLVRTFNNVYPTYSVGEFLKDVDGSYEVLLPAFCRLVIGQKHCLR